MFYIIGALVAILISAILLINVIGPGEQATNSSEAQAGMNDLAVIRNAVVNMGFLSNFTGLTNELMEQGGQMPTSMMAGASGAGNDVDPWGGVVTVAVGTSTSQFTVEFDGVPTNACTQLAQYNASDLGSVTINGTAITPPVTPAAAVGDCSKTGQGSGAGNAVIWTFNG